MKKVAFIHYAKAGGVYINAHIYKKALKIKLTKIIILGERTIFAKNH